MAERGGAQYRSTLFASYRNIQSLLDDHAADAVMFDLEDMVAVADKPIARIATAEAIAALGERAIGRFVRVNGWQTGHLINDVTAIVVPGLTGIALPKAESADQVRALDLLIGELEIERGLTLGAIEIIPLAETAPGLFFTYDLVIASPRVKRYYGVMNATKDGDGARSLRLDVGRDGKEWVPIGTHVLMAARSAGISNILGATPMEPHNHDRTRALAEASRVYGANGSLCIHPDQIAIINEVYSPDQREVDHAREVLVAIAAAIERGESTTVVDGELATYSHVRSAYDTIELARRFGLPVGELPEINVLGYDNPAS